MDECMSEQRPRAREFGVRVGTLPSGAANAITDVADVRVGHVTLIEGDGPLVPGVGPVRTGFTVILPHGGNLFREKVPCAVHVINGFGKCMGQEQIEEFVSDLDWFTLVYPKMTFTPPWTPEKMSEDAKFALGY